MTDERRQTAFTPTYGAHLIDTDRTRFVLWAPSARAVHVEVEGQPSKAMQTTCDGHYEAEVTCGHRARYRYRVFGKEDEEGTLVPDPASRAQHGDIDGPSLVIDPLRYQWRHADWRGRPWHEAVLYELHIGTLGGFDGVRQKLAYLADLGVTAIELMPVAEFPGERNWGYDGVLPYAVEAAYGSPDAMKALIDAAHGQGLMVFLDVVYNHFGPDGNYLATYADAFFRDDLQTPWGPSIDFRAPQVRRYFIDNALLWLQEYRLDGLRFDAVHAISERDFLIEMAREIRHHVDPRRHVHLVLENEGNTASLLDADHYTAQWSDDWHNVMHVLLTGEHEGYYSDFVEDATAKLVRCLSEGFIYQGEQSRHGHVRGEPSAHLPANAFVIFLQNHDQVGNRALGERLSLLAGPDALAAASVLLMLSPMVPLLFMGEEWGSTRPFLFFTEHHDELADAVREGRRSEFADFSAFRDEATRRRIPDPNALQTFEASVPDYEVRDTPPHDDWLDRTRTLLRLRHREIVPRSTGARSLGAEALGEKAVVARWRMNDGSRLTIALNLSNREVPAREIADGRCLFESRPGVAVGVSEGRLLPHGAAVWLDGEEVIP